MLLNTVVVIALAQAPDTRIEFGRPGWYRVELADGQRLTVKILQRDGSSLSGVYRGLHFQIREEHVQNVISLETVWNENPQRSAVITPAVESRLRDSLEALGTLDKDDMLEAFRDIEKLFPDCRALVHESVRHSSAGVRKLCVKLLGERGETALDLEAVKPLLRDSERTVRLAAVMAVRSFGKAGRKAMLDYLKWEPEPNNRKIALKSIERWKDVESTNELFDYLSIEKDRHVRLFVLQALRYLTGKDLGDDPEVWVQYREWMRAQQQMAAMKAADEKEKAEVSR